VLRKLKILFILLAAVSALVWVFGLLMSVIVPIFGGVRADRIGAILFSVSLFAESLLYFFGWLAQRTDLNKEKKQSSFPVEKKYGNRK
jgi:hypothetical protein